MIEALIEKARTTTREAATGTWGKTFANGVEFLKLLVSFYWVSLANGVCSSAIMNAHSMQYAR